MSRWSNVREQDYFNLRFPRWKGHMFVTGFFLWFKKNIAVLSYKVNCNMRVSKQSAEFPESALVGILGVIFAKQIFTGNVLFVTPPWRITSLFT